MPMPRWFTRVTKHVFNPLELRRGQRPVLHHLGRVSGTEHRTPLDAHPVDGGFLFVLVYGPDSDWCRNVLAAGRARLTVDGADHRLVNPRLVDEAEAFAALASDVPRPPRLLRITDFLRMDHA